MQPGAGAPVIVRVEYDEAYTLRRHTRGGRLAIRELARGRDAHVFDDGVDLRDLEAKVWAGGTCLGSVGSGQRAVFERFVWLSPTRVGTRLQTGRQDVPLFWVEIKGKTVGDTWVYHLAPRARPAS